MRTSATARGAAGPARTTTARTVTVSTVIRVGLADLNSPDLHRALPNEKRSDEYLAYRVRVVFIIERNEAEQSEDV